ncbi:MAG: arginine--tRNA ligase [Gammaproteobacteria bacterium]|nr:arginine--tRNA ligase [Gammaproteobacteria bacterium]
MRQKLKQLIENAIGELQLDLGSDFNIDILIEPTKDQNHGDYACNFALLAAKKLKTNPRSLADNLVTKLNKSDLIKKIEIAGPGFINFFISPVALMQIIFDINQLKESYGKSELGKNQKVHLEFVSSNPTGPLHVGHGRHAAFGSCVANLLESIGFSVYREYYINDAGRQMQILGFSLWLRYLELKNYKIKFPSKGYQGDYVSAIAQDFAAQISSGSELNILADSRIVDLYLNKIKNITVPDDLENGDSYIDQCIAIASEVMTQANFKTCMDFVCAQVLTDIKADLEEFGVRFDNWFSEAQMIATGAIERTLEYLEAKNYLYKKDGATWFKTSEFGDEKDRVLIRSNGQNTYFAPDIAYHLSKIERGNDIVADILGSDHHGYIPRLRACLRAFDKPDEKFITKLVQFVDLYRNNQKVPMSTRSGSFITLRELRNEVGNDATRFFYIMRKVDQLIDFDIDLAKSKSNENPVYYIQYAHARICSIMRQLIEKGYNFDSNYIKNIADLSKLNVLEDQHELDLLNHLSNYVEMIESAALAYEPHRVVQYLKELANLFHKYYNACAILTDDMMIRDARVYLILAVKQIISNALTLLGISSPEKM